MSDKPETEAAGTKSVHDKDGKISARDISGKTGSKAGSGKSDPGKTGPGKPPADIDLAPTEVSDVTAAPEPVAALGDAALEATSTEMPVAAKAGPETGEVPEPAPTILPQATPASPRLVPGLIGLVAGAIGGFGAYYAGDLVLPKAPQADTTLVSRLGALEQRIAALKPGTANPAAPQALVDRLEKLEVALGNASKGQEMLGVELGKLGTALSTEVAERKKALAAQPGTPVGIIGTPGPAPADIEGLKSRVGSIESAAKALPEALSSLDSKLQSVQPKIESVTRDVAALSGKLAAREAIGVANARLAAVSLLEEGVAAGQALARPVKLLQELGIAETKLAAFTPFLDKGMPDARALRAELQALKPAPKSDLAPAEISMLDRLKAGVSSLVEIRKTGTISGTDDAAHLARADAALGRGDIVTALALVDRLSAAAAPAYAGWRSRVDARLKAAEAVKVQRADALAALAEAVGSVK
jgi:hypothetical protein